MSKVSKISPSLAAYIDDHAAASGPGGPSDPLYQNAALAAISKTARSAESRNGLILQRALFEALSTSADLTVIHPMSFPVTREAQRELDIHEISFCCSDLHLPISENLVGTAELDLVTIRHRTRVGAVYELRRGNGRIGYRAMREALRKLVAARMLLRAWIYKQLGIWLDTTAAHLILYYQVDVDAGFPPGMILTKDDLDGHFGVSVTALMDAAAERHGARVERRLDQIIQGMRHTK